MESGASRAVPYEAIVAMSGVGRGAKRNRARARSADRIRLAGGAGGLRDINLEARRDLGKRAVDVHDVLIELGGAGRWFDSAGLGAGLTRPRGDG